MYQYLSRKKLILPFIMSVVLLCVSLMGQFGIDWLSYDRVSILNGELWRVITSHFTHTGLNHLALNISGLIIVFYLFGHLFSTSLWLMSIAICMICVSLGLFINHPELAWYVGLSGVLHGLIVVGALSSITRRLTISHFVLFGVFSKLLFEQLYGPSQDTMKLIDSPVIVDAHLYGAIAGCFIGIIVLITKRYLPTR